MTLTERFVEYAMEFEKTYVDDDWARLEGFFSPEATYEVRNAPFACRLEGRDAIFRGIRKSLDGFDRRFATRNIEVTEPPKEEGSKVTLGWRGTYTKEGVPAVTIRGRSEARYAGDRIVALSDTYEDGNTAEVTAWMEKHGAGLDPSYV
ncbi:MAG: nuclear transport factor 2 family protein [Candidatus Binatia bacterium]